MKTLGPAKFLVTVVMTMAVVFFSSWRTQAIGPISGVVFEDFNANGVRDTSTTVPSNGNGTTALAVDRGVADYHLRDESERQLHRLHQL